MNFWETHGIAWIVLGVSLLAADFEWSIKYWLFSGPMFYVAFLSFRKAGKQLEDSVEKAMEKGESSKGGSSG